MGLALCPQRNIVIWFLNFGPHCSGQCPSECENECMGIAQFVRRVRDRLLKRSPNVVMDASLSFQTSLGIKKFSPGHPGPVVDYKQRNKRGGKSGQPAREDLRLDRSDPSVTVKTHHVEEQADDGTWHTVHDERVEYPAKRRPDQKDT